ncbi:MAG: TonB-dependent receptor [candidate division KSB1 bacterium]|nr:TonB-dependent receptor [candidate division KSB1 bacterium]MDZ7301128.1 TonB-dependent receptor [candidate division KSB1 bacterium]MDZ7311988.1 TonB-dependent receptor [candidate division KSB1 bacterium]
MLGGHANSLFAQTSGKIVGVVKDAQTGEALPGANVMIEGTTLGAATDMKGYYIILRVPPGHYNVRAEFIGYQRVVMKYVEVLTDLTTTLNFALQPEVLEGGEVVIVAEKPLVRKDLTSSEARISADKIEKMPVQEMGSLLDLQAGITRGTDGQLHIRGGRSSEVAYMINGISITDDFYRTQALTVENESIQELQVISGTFNAEYGNAMSGVINIVTKTGSNDFAGKLEAWAGDYLSTRTDIFWNIDDLNPAAENNLQGTLSGPIIRDRLNFFLTGRRYENEGWLYGPNVYTPQGRTQLGDSSAVAMNGTERWSGQGVLKWKILNPLTLKIDFLGSKYSNHSYNHVYRLNPNGMRGFQGYGATVIANLTHALSSRTFYETIISYKVNEDKSRLYEDPFDSRYAHPDSLTAGTYQFFKAGTDLFRSSRSTKSMIGKFDLTSQVTPRHQLKAGVEVQKDRIDFENLTLVPARDANGQQIEPFQPYIESTSTPNHSLFRREPDKFAAYIQDKIEYQNVIINIGLRYDYFRSNGRIPADPEDPNIYLPLKPRHIYKDHNGNGVIDIAEKVEENKYSLEERKSLWYKKATAKTQLSPRFGIAYPITDKGVIHFSYGIFQQIPEYSQLFDGDEMKLTEGQGIQGPFGNPDLNPQRTTMYELGLKQQISDNIGIDVTGYYRDIRDWISTSPPIPTYSAGVTYSKRINRDFANAKGITLTITRRLANGIAFDVDYTYQVVQGTNSSPEDEYLALTAGTEPRKQLSPLDWDQRHAFNLNVHVGQNNWGCNVITRFNSGQPYTPEILSGTLTGQNVLSGLATNTRRKPNRLTVDLNAFRNFTLRNLNFELFLRVYNLFDAQNPLTIWADSGKPDYTRRQNTADAAEADPSWFIRPDFYSEPRRVQVGTKFSF